MREIVPVQVRLPESTHNRNLTLASHRNVEDRTGAIMPYRSHPSSGSSFKFWRRNTGRNACLANIRSPQRQRAVCEYCNEDGECGCPNPHRTPPVLSGNKQAKTTQQKDATDQGQDTQEDRGRVRHVLFSSSSISSMYFTHRAAASRLGDVWPNAYGHFAAL